MGRRQVRSNGFNGSRVEHCLADLATLQAISLVQGPRQVPYSEASRN